MPPCQVDARDSPVKNPENDMLLLEKKSHEDSTSSRLSKWQG
jgi:hypothetical protein